LDGKTRRDPMTGNMLEEKVVSHSKPEDLLYFQQNKKKTRAEEETRTL
jgi:hypothetical protein